MKKHIFNNFICLLLSLAMLFTCLSNDKLFHADTMSFYAQDNYIIHESENNTQAVIDLQSGISTTSKLCTHEMLGEYNPLQSLRLTNRNSFESSGYKISILNSFMALSPYIPSYFYEKNISEAISLKYFNTAIICYIHNKDGKKA